MLGRTYENQHCSAARTLELVGERWSLLILRDAIFGGYTRFSQFQKSLGIATNVLTSRLEGFVSAGLMERKPQSGSDQTEYGLTTRGRELASTIIALTEWGDKWLSPGPHVFHDRISGQVVHLELQRPDKGGAVPLADIVARPRQVSDAA